MDHEHQIRSDLGPLYPIGAVASLTGLSANTLRTWDRRHGVSSTARTPGGGRRYTEADVTRLLLLGQVTERGIAISTAAEMTDEELRGALSRGNDTRSRLERELDVFLIHPHLRSRLVSSNLKWVVRGAACDATDLGKEPERACDLLLVDLELLGSRPEAALETALAHCGATQAIVLYHFARRDTIEALANTGARLLKEPLELEQVDDAAWQQLRSRGDEPLGLVGREPRVPNPKPRFLPTELAQLREIESRLYCECPNHLATLVNSLMSFEDYSEGCASKSRADEFLHRTLYEGAGAARCIIEALLENVIKHDEIELGER